MLWKKKLPIGVDLGSYSIKVCAFDSRRSSCKIWSDVLLPERRTGDDVPTPEHTTELVGALLKRAEPVCQPWSKRVALSVDDPQIATGYVELPNLPLDQLMIALPAQVSREIAQPLGEVSIFQLPVALIGGGSGSKAFFYVTIPKSVIEMRQRQFVELGFEVASCEPSLLSLLREVSKNQSAELTRAAAVVSVGFRTTTVVLLRDAQPYYARHFRLAGRDFTYAFQMSEQVEWADAEEKKRAYNARDGYYVVEPFVQRWLDEVSRSIEFGCKKYAGIKPETVLLTGGSALWNGLDERLSSALGLPVTRENWRKLRPNESSRQDLPPHSVAMGLVLPK